MARHQNKHIQAAIHYAEEHGWKVVKAGPRAHLWGTLYCPHRGRDGCHICVMSTPRNPDAHARDIRQGVDGCPHERGGQEEVGK